MIARIIKIVLSLLAPREPTAPTEPATERALTIPAVGDTQEITQHAVTGGISEENAMQNDQSDMIIRVDRYLSDDDATLSRVYVDDVLVVYAVEDEKRAVKVWGETRIDPGEYEVTLRTFGTFHDRHKESPHYRADHVGMLWIRNVPNFEAILFHTGNDDDDTAGCIVVGTYADEDTMKVHLSRNGYRKFYNMVKDAARDGRLKCIINDLDGAIA